MSIERALTQPAEYFLKKKLALPQCHALPSILVNVNLLERDKMMNLTIRKIFVLGLIGIILLLANILVVANWINDTGIAEKAGWIRREFLTGTAIAIVLVLLLLLVSPKNASGKAIARRCPVCDKRLVGDPSYCGNCGSKVS